MWDIIICQKLVLPCSVSFAWFSKAHGPSSSHGVCLKSTTPSCCDSLWCLSWLLPSSPLIALCCHSFAALVHFCSQSLNIDLLRDKLVLWYCVCSSRICIHLPIMSLLGQIQSHSPSSRMQLLCSFNILIFLAKTVVWPFFYTINLFQSDTPTLTFNIQHTDL